MSRTSEMKSYLSLVPISAKVHKRQNRMTILCIVIAVLLVTAIFSLADMDMRTENAFMEAKHGSWHLKLTDPPDDLVETLNQQADLVVGTAANFNTDADHPYTIGGKKAALSTGSTEYLEQMAAALEEGALPQNEHDVMLSSNAKIALSVQIGDTVTLQTPAGAQDFTVCGFGSDDASMYEGQSYLIGATFTPDVFASILAENDVSFSPDYYLLFSSASAAAKAAPELSARCAVEENTAIMGMAGQSSNTSMQGLYQIAAALFVMVLLAGVLMISGSMNSSIAQRTKFFGMLRCIGASRSQIIRFVRLEALSWCKSAVPLGLVLGTGVSWVLCGILHYGIGGEFATMPVFALSPVGLASGAAVGIITVLLAAQAPAKRAAKVSPMAAVSGSSDTAAVRHSFRLRGGRIENTLGVHHATASKKNWGLVTASFALSMILFFLFAVLLQFVKLLLPTLSPWQTDLSLSGYANAAVLDRSLVETIAELPGVASVYGGNYIGSLAVASSREGVDSICLVSCSDYLLDASQDALADGSMKGIYGDSDEVLIQYNRDNPLQLGDTLTINGQTVTVRAAVSQGIGRDGCIVMCSQQTFDRLVGAQPYSMIFANLDASAPDSTVAQVSRLADNAGSEVIFYDNRESNRRNSATYQAALWMGYGFIGILGLITLVNIINNISLSVSARTKQYGAMRAVGMDGAQLTRMITAEAVTYVASGLAAGCLVGLPLSRLLYGRLITHYFGLGWQFPAAQLGICIVFAAVAGAAAVHAPAKRICSMAITETINEL